MAYKKVSVKYWHWYDINVLAYSTKHRSKHQRNTTADFSTNFILGTNRGGCENNQYQFWVQAVNEKHWKVLVDFGSFEKFTFSKNILVLYITVFFWKRNRKLTIQVDEQFKGRTGLYTFLESCSLELRINKYKEEVK